MIAACFLTLLGLLSLWLLRREGLLERWPAVLAATAVLVLALFLRGLCLDHETLDYVNFLSRWVAYFRQNGGFRALRDSIGNYNLPYLYFLALFSYIDYADLYLIKFLSLAFDVALAWGVMKLVGHFTRGAAPRLAGFLGTLCLPTVILNGALWGQCDCIYTALGVLSIWAALDKKPRLSLVFITLSFAFKLQAVFFMPVFFVLLVKRRIRWRQLWVVPATYAAAMLPAVVMGRPFLDTLTLYFDQAGSVGSGLNYNSSSLFAFYRGGGDETRLARLGIAAAFLFCVALLWILSVSRVGGSDRMLLAAFTLTAVCVPLLLPHMHDRYFFGADILSLALALTALPLLPTVPLASFASLLGYHAYLKQRYLLPMRYGAAALVLAAACIVGYMIWLARGEKFPERPKDFY